jgi:hypothetical protein
MAPPKQVTAIDTNGSGISDSSVRPGLIDSIIASAAVKSAPVDVAYRMPGPIIMRTAPRSLVARDIKSPVRCAW